MANARELQTRMKSIQDTMKITNAMYMISSAKLKKARKSLENTEPYFQMLQGTIARIVRHLPEMEHRYFESEEAAAGESGKLLYGSQKKQDSKRRGYIVIAADKGLAGAYNHNIVKLVEEQLQEGQENLLFVVGELGRTYFNQHHIPIYQQFHYTVQDPTLDRAREIAETVISLYDQKQLDEIYVIYTYSVNSMTAEAKIKRLLPLGKKVLINADLADVYAEDIRLIPSPESVLDNVVPDYVTGFLYGALTESFCSEQNSRMMAMQAAADNAQKMLSELQTAYNRVRQTAITQEITEVIAGAKAQKKRRRET